VYTIHCTLYTAHYTLYTIHCTLHTTLYTVHYTLSTIHCTLYTVHCTLYTVHYTLYTAHYTLFMQNNSKTNTTLFQTEHHFYTAMCFDPYWIIIRSWYKTFRTQQFFKLFALYFSEISQILVLKI
jgi:hypothetical protein